MQNNLSETASTKKRVNSKAKGSRIELQIAHWFQENGYASARRTQQYNGTAGTSDIEVEELSCFHIECKGTASASIQKSTLLNKNERKPGWLNQVSRDCPEGKLWVILNKANDKDLIALISIKHFKFIASGNITPIAVTGESFAPEPELEKAYQVLRTIKKFNTVMDYGFEDTIPVLVYEVTPGNILVAVTADVWINWVKQCKRLNNTVSS